MVILKKRILPVFLAFCIGAGTVGTCKAASIDELIFGTKCYNEKILPVAKLVMVAAVVGVALYVVWIFARKNLGQLGVGAGVGDGEDQQVVNGMKVSRETYEKYKRIKTGNLDQVKSFLDGLDDNDWLLESADDLLLPDLIKNGDLEKLKLVYFRLNDEFKKRFILNYSVGSEKYNFFEKACLSGNDEVFKFLFDEVRKMVDLQKEIGVYKNRPDACEKLEKRHNVQIGIASKHGKLDLVKWLVQEKHVDINLTSENPVKLARENGHEDIAKYLIEKGVKE